MTAMVLALLGLFLALPLRAAEADAASLAWDQWQSTADSAALLARLAEAPLWLDDAGRDRLAAAGGIDLAAEPDAPGLLVAGPLTTPARGPLAGEFEWLVVGYLAAPLRAGTDLYGNPVTHPVTPWRPGQQRVWRQLVRLHTTRGLAATAARAGRQLLVAARLQAHRYDRWPLDAQGRPVAMNAWLTADQYPGDPTVAAEERAGDLLLYRAAEPRTDLDWFAQLAHELGHRCGPKIGRYADSRLFEPWLEGKLAELLLTWDALESGDLDAPADAAAALAAQRAQLVEQFASRAIAGPHQPALLGTDDDGARGALGLVLWARSRLEPVVFEGWLRSQSAGAIYSGAELERSLRIFLTTTPRWRWRLDPALPDALIYLPRGAWLLGAYTGDAAADAVDAQIVIDGELSPGGRATSAAPLGVTSTGRWARVGVQSQASATWLELRRAD